MSRLALLGLVAACTPEPDPDLLDPDACVSCHPSHVQEWRGSMHAHAADDPVFRALNEAAVASGRVEPDFCITCHAPVAARLGETQDGLDLDEVPEHLRGVTCAFCHQLDAVEGTHNGQVGWSFDGLFRGGIADPIRSDFHDAGYAAIMDRNARESSDACGACHDIVVPGADGAGLHLEKTWLEWSESIFAEGVGRQSCSHCHLPGRDGVVATVPDAPVRRVHDHSMPAIDVALIEWPEREAQRAAIQALLDETLLAELCLTPGAGGSDVRITLENALAGHDFPSGASHDRRVWVELVATRGGQTVFESGVVPEGVAMTDVADASRIELHDLAYDDEGKLSHGIVDAVRLEERALPGAPDPLAPHARRFTLSIPGSAPDQVSMRVRLRPIGLDLLDTHIEAGRLDPAVRGEMPTFDLGSTELVWRAEGESCVGATSGI